MRIYEGAARQDWEEVLLLDLADRLVLQGLGLPPMAGDAENLGPIQKRTHEFDDERIALLMDRRAAQRSEWRSRRAGQEVPAVDVTNFYEHALRILGRYMDEQRPRDVFLFEQQGNFVVRLLEAGHGTAASRHVLAEFTRDEILTMIDRASAERGRAAHDR